MVRACWCLGVAVQHHRVAGWARYCNGQRDTTLRDEAALHGNEGSSAYFILCHQGWSVAIGELFNLRPNCFHHGVHGVHGVCEKHGSPQFKYQA